MFLRTITVLSVVILVILAFTFEHEENNNSNSISNTSSSEPTEQRETMSSSYPSSQPNQTITTSQSTPNTALPVGDSSTTTAYFSPVSTYNVNTSLNGMTLITDGVTEFSTEDYPSQNYASITSELINLEITNDIQEFIASEINYNEEPTTSNEAANSSTLDVTTCKSSSAYTFEHEENNNSSSISNTSSSESTEQRETMSSSYPSSQPNQTITTSQRMPITTLPVGDSSTTTAYFSPVSTYNVNTSLNEKALITEGVTKSSNVDIPSQNHASITSEHLNLEITTDKPEFVASEVNYNEVPTASNEAANSSTIDVTTAYTIEHEENNNSSSIGKTSSSESNEQRETMSSSYPSSQRNQTITTSQRTPITALPVGDSSTTTAYFSPVSTYNVNTSLNEKALITEGVTKSSNVDIPSQNHASTTSEHLNLEITTDKPEFVASEVNCNEVPTASNEAANLSTLDVTTGKSSSAYTFENEENNNTSSITKTSSSESTEQRETISSSVPSSQSNQTVTTSQSTPFTALPVGDSSTTLAHSSPVSTYNVNTSLSEMAVITYSVTTEDIPSQNHASITSEHLNLEITTDKPEFVASEVNINEVPTASNEAANSSTLDVTTCKSSSDDALLPMVLIGGNDGLYWAKLAEERLPVLVYRQGLNAYSVDYHYKYNFVFFTAYGNLIIRMRNNNIFPAGDVKAILRNVIGHVEISVDWVQDHIYWLSGALKAIERANLDGENRTIIYQNRSEISENPRSLVIDPYERFLFFVDSDNAYRFNLSNNQLETIIKSSIDNETRFTCLALNRHKKRLYFSGEDKDGRPYVASSLYDGKGIITHNVGGHWNFIFSIDIFRDTLFFANYEENMADSLYRKQLTSNCTAEKIFIPPKPGNDIGQIRMYHPNIQSPEDFRTRLEADDEML